MPVIFDTDPAKVHGPMIQGVINTLEAAARAGVQRYVLSSSSKAVHSNAYTGPRELTSDLFNYDASIRCEMDHPRMLMLRLRG